MGSRRPTKITACFYFIGYFTKGSTALFRIRTKVFSHRISRFALGLFGIAALTYILAAAWATFSIFLSNCIIEINARHISNRC